MLVDGYENGCDPIHFLTMKSLAGVANAADYDGFFDTQDSLESNTLDKNMSGFRSIARRKNGRRTDSVVTLGLRAKEGSSETMKSDKRNPDWTDQELDIAVETFMQIESIGQKITAEHPAIINASIKLKSLRIHETPNITEEFRSPDGVRRRISYIKKIASGGNIKGRERYKRAWERYQIRKLAAMPEDKLEQQANDIADVYQTPQLSETEKETLVLARKGQGAFREKLIILWGECPITQCKSKTLLKASHVKPWAVSTNRERLDKFNGILLSPTFDTLFDKGLISFDEAGTIMLSKLLTVNDAIALGVRPNTNINTNKEQQSYLEYHRNFVFKK